MKTATELAQKIADQELDACCKWVSTVRAYWMKPETLRSARRPKPPSLKTQALAVLENSEICDHLSTEHATILRHALEQLDD